MSEKYCPICYTLLVIKESTPCYICGCWHEDIIEEMKGKEYFIYSLKDGREVILCRGCEIYELYCGFGFLLETLKIDKEYALSEVGKMYRTPNSKHIDKFCEECNMRWGLLKMGDG